MNNETDLNIDPSDCETKSDAAAETTDDASCCISSSEPALDLPSCCMTAKGCC